MRLGTDLRREQLSFGIYAILQDQEQEESLEEYLNAKYIQRLPGCCHRYRQLLPTDKLPKCKKEETSPLKYKEEYL